MPDGMFSNVDDGQRSMRSNIVVRSSTSTPCEIRFSRYELANDARPRTMNRPTNAAGNHSADELRSNSARSVMMPVSLASSGSVTAAIAVATSANPSTLRCTSTIRIRRRRFGSSSRRGWEGDVMRSRATIRARERAPDAARVVYAIGSSIFRHDAADRPPAQPPRRRLHVDRGARRAGAGGPRADAGGPAVDPVAVRSLSLAHRRADRQPPRSRARLERGGGGRARPAVHEFVQHRARVPPRRHRCDRLRARRTLAAAVAGRCRRRSRPHGRVLPPPCQDTDRATCPPCPQRSTSASATRRGGACATH